MLHPIFLYLYLLSSFLIGEIIKKVWEWLHQGFGKLPHL